MKGLFILHSALFLINIPHSPASQAKLPHLYVLLPKCPKKPTALHFLFFPFLMCYGFQSFYFTCRFLLCSGNCQWNTQRGEYSHTPRFSFHLSLKMAWKVKKKKKSQIKLEADAHVFPFLMSFREGVLQCLFCSSRQGRPFCLWKSQWEQGSGAPSKTLAHHRSALSAPLAK